MGNKEKGVFYISLKGNDQWSGRLEEPNVDHSDGPFATIDRAKSAVSSLDKKGRPIKVLIRGGTYYLDQPLEFGHEDSGSLNSPVSYEGYADETVVLSGGKRIVGWQEIAMNGKRVWTANAPDWDFHSLWVDDERRYRPRYPKEGTLHLKEPSTVTDYTNRDFFEGTNVFMAKKEHVRNWYDLDSVEFVAMTIWAESRLPVQSVNTETGRIETKLRSAMNFTEELRTSKYFWDNVFEEFDTEGQWYCDKLKGKLYYIPLMGEKMNEVEIVVPYLTHIIIAKGDEKRGEFFEHVHLKNLNFAHNEWWRTSETKIMRWKINVFLPFESRDIEVKLISDDKGADHQAAVSCEASIQLEEARHCTIEKCTIFHTGSYGIELGKGCKDNSILACSFYDLGAGGIKMGTQVVDDAKTTGFNRVYDCEIYNCGRIFYSSIGIWVGQSGNNTIAHNLIHDLYYSGLSLGWTWGYGPSGVENNLVEFNHIYNIAKDGLLHDLSAVYTLGKSPGTVIRNNVIHDVGNDFYANGIYTDEGSSNVLWENNIIYNVNGRGYYHHFGRENILRNNIIAFASLGQVARGKVEGCTASYTFERNIVYFKEGELLFSPTTLFSFADGNFRFKDNLYWYAGEEKSKFAGTFDGCSFDEWREKGFDLNSIIEDPGFKDPDHYDFSLLPGSPAERIGFIPIDVSKVGIRK